jgi:hypothetical protein
MGSKHTPPTITQWMKFPWEKDELPSDDEINEIREMLQNENKQKTSEQ